MGQPRFARLRVVCISHCTSDFLPPCMQIQMRVFSTAFPIFPTCWIFPSFSNAERYRVAVASETCRSFSTSSHGRKVSARCTGRLVLRLHLNSDWRNDVVFRTLHCRAPWMGTRIPDLVWRRAVHPPVCGHDGSSIGFYANRRNERQSLPGRASLRGRVLLCNISLTC